MKKVLFIGDIHGTTEWEEIAKNGLKQFYEIVFLGDYIDSFYKKPVDQLYNLNNLVKFIRKNKTQVTALIGNHDYAVINSHSAISGYQHLHAHEYKKVFQDNVDLFQIAWGYTNDTTKKYTLATHAGLTKNYWERYILPQINEGGFIHKITEGKEIQMHEALNYLKDKKDILWKVGFVRGGFGTPGVLWADYTEVIDDRYSGINQIFGHTPQPTIRVDQYGDDLVACVDSWGNKKGTSLLMTL